MDGVLGRSCGLADEPRESRRARAVATYTRGLAHRPLCTHSPNETDVRCARRARPRNPRGRPRPHVGRVVPRLATATRSDSSAATAPARRRSPRCSPAICCPPTAGSSAPANSATCPQDPRSGDPEMLARTRILDARGLGTLALGMHEASLAMGDDDADVAARAMRKYANLTERFEALGGYAAEAEAASIAHNLSLPDRILDQQLKTLSGGQRRRIELARILFSDAESMILDEPTNHLDADSVVWLREFLKNYKGGLIVISHDVELVGETVNRVFYLDANRQVIDVYNMNWKNYLRQRVADEERRKKERVNVEKKATAAAAAGGALRREGLEGRRRAPDGGARREDALGPRRRAPGGSRREAPLPEARAVRQDAAHGIRTVEVVRIARDLHRCRPRDRPRLEGRRARAQRRRQDHAAAHPRGRRQARHRPDRARARAQDRLLRAGAREPRRRPLGAREHDVGGARHHRDGCPQGARLVPVHRRRRAQARRRALGWREDAALARDPRRLEREHAAARRADEQPRPRLARGDPRRARRTTRAPSCSSRTTRAPSRR